MFVELTTVAGEKIYPNPRHVALIEPVAVQSEDEQSFITEITIVDVGVRRVSGSPTEVRKALNGATR